MVATPATILVPRSNYAVVGGGGGGGGDCDPDSPLCARSCHSRIRSSRYWCQPPVPPQPRMRPPQIANPITLKITQKKKRKNNRPKIQPKPKKCGPKP